LQIRSEFLPDLDDRSLVAAQDGDELVGRLDQPLLGGRRPCLKKVIQHIDVDQRYQIDPI
jgi:hypothetical protein